MALGVDVLGIRYELNNRMGEIRATPKTNNADQESAGETPEAEEQEVEIELEFFPELGTFSIINQ